MKEKFFYKSLFFIFSLCITLFLQTCGDDATNPKNNYMSGTITFVDVNFYHGSEGYYTVSFYTDTVNPYHRKPLSSDSLAINVSGGTATAYFKVSNLPVGNYYVASVWVRKSDGACLVLGIYGCGIQAGCTGTVVTYPNYAGTGNLSFESHADLSSYLYKYP